MGNRWYRWTAIAAAVMVLVVAIRTCGTGSDLANRDPGETIDAGLTLQTVTLEQPDENGILLWRLRADSVTYSPDQQLAQLTGLDGEFFQAGEVVYTVEAETGEVQQNGETLFLRGNLVATSLEDELTLESERLKWQPKDDRLIMGDFEDDESTEPDADSNQDADEDRADKDGESAQSEDAADAEEIAPDSKTAEKPPVKGFNPDLEAIANVVTISNQNNRVELSGNVSANSKAEPWLTFTSEALLWLTQQEQLTAEQPLVVERYEDKALKTLTDRLKGQTGTVQLADQIVTLEESVELEAIAQPLNIKSERAVWDIEAQIVALDQPVNIEQPTRKLTASAGQASLDLGKNVIYLIGNVQANGEENDSELLADRVTWQTQTQLVEAEGNVRYRQAAEPKIAIAGPKATGNIEDGTLVITGGEAGEVVTEIIPAQPSQ